MPSIKHLTPFVAVAAQLQPTDLPALAAAGFRCVINNRPDHEGADQPTSEQIEDAARASGLDYHHLPVMAGRIGDADIVDFRELLASVHGPVLAFCRTGTRSTTLWALSEAQNQPADQLMAIANKAGYPLEALRPRLEQLARQEYTA